MRNIVILNSLHFSYPLPILMRVSYNTLIVKQNTSDYYKYTYFQRITQTIMLKKEHKILVVVSPEPAERKRLLSRLAVRLGFALIPSDAAKIISNDIYGIDLATAYFVFCSSYNFRGAVLTNQRLYEMAARGLCVAVGVRSIPREYEFICKVFYPEDFP